MKPMWGREKTLYDSGKAGRDRLQKRGRAKVISPRGRRAGKALNKRPSAEVDREEERQRPIQNIRERDGAVKKSWRWNPWQKGNLGRRGLVGAQETTIWLQKKKKGASSVNRARGHRDRLWYPDKRLSSAMTPGQEYRFAHRGGEKVHNRRQGLVDQQPAERITRQGLRPEEGNKKNIKRKKSGEETAGQAAGGGIFKKSSSKRERAGMAAAEKEG